MDMKFKSTKKCILVLIFRQLSRLLVVFDYAILSRQFIVVAEVTDKLAIFELVPVKALKHPFPVSPKEVPIFSSKH
jgi:hypothetical protein